MASRMVLKLPTARLAVMTPSRRMLPVGKRAFTHITTAHTTYRAPSLLIASLPRIRAYSSTPADNKTDKKNEAAAAEGDAKIEKKQDQDTDSATDTAKSDTTSAASSSSQSVASEASTAEDSLDTDWEENLNLSINEFTQLPHKNFGVNQHIIINAEFKEALRQVLWQFRAPIRYAFAYGSGVFPQSSPSGKTITDEELRKIHPKAPAAVKRAQDGSPKMIDFIFGVTFTEHWHSLNLRQHRDHYSFLGSLGSGVVSSVQDRYGAGVYYNTYAVVNGILIKYGVVNLDTLCKDLSEWDTLYLAGRLQKPVKILRDDARVRMANQVNLLGALRTAMLLLPPTFTERELYGTIANISYLGDPRMSLPTENPNKVANIVRHNMPNFRRLYAPLIETLPNLQFDDPACTTAGWLEDAKADLKLVQDMDPVKRGNMVRRLPKTFRRRLYFQYQKKLSVPQADFDAMMAESAAEGAETFRRREGGGFERRIASDEPAGLRGHVRSVIKQTINWPSTTQSLKGLLTAGPFRSARYMGEKFAKWRSGSSTSTSATTSTSSSTSSSSSDSSKSGKAD